MMDERMHINKIKNIIIKDDHILGSIVWNYRYSQYHLRMDKNYPASLYLTTDEIYEISKYMRKISKIKNREDAK